MEIQEIAKGLLLLQPDLFEDDRGVFNVVMNNKQFFFDFNVVQINQSTSKANTVRGLHFQYPPFGQSKIVWCSRGSMIDVCLDIRPKSDTFGQVFKFLLDDVEKRTLIIPKGFAHGFRAIDDDTVVSYAVDAERIEQYELSIFPFDVNLSIDWGINHKEAVLSEKDKVGWKFEYYKNQILGKF